MLDLVVSQGCVSDGYTSGRVGRRELPWRIHADDVEQAASMLLLATAKLLKLEGQNIGKDGHAPELPLVDVRHNFLLIVNLDVCIKLEVSQEPFILLSIRVFFHEELPFQQENVSFDF